MTFDEAMEYMENLNKLGIHEGLEGIRLLLSALDNPEKDLKFVHIVGTNGKGSTGTFISEILKASGKRTGHYQSPRVFNELEIIKVNGKNISKADYARLVALISQRNEFSCTRFEVETALSFLYFKEKKCDICVIEAGMGGLLDATNIIPTPLITAFTSIGLDHFEYLGDNLQKITENKAGVIKFGTSVISTVQEDLALDIIKAGCSLHNADFTLSDYRKATSVKLRLNGATFNYKGLKNLKISMPGEFQIKNACLAIDLAFSLAIKEKYIYAGLLNAKISGRFEVISNKPLFIIDGAHNEPASLELRKSLETYFTNKRFIYIMGMLKDKDAVTVIKNTVDLADMIFAVATPNKKRTMSAFELASLIKEVNPKVTSLDSIEEAVEMALMLADGDTVIVAFGSLSHLEKIKTAVLNKKNIKKDYHGVI